MVALKDVLETIDEFGSASLGLIAWEFEVREDTLKRTWQAMIETDLIRPTEIDPDGETMYELGPEGETRLAELRALSVEPI